MHHLRYFNLCLFKIDAISKFCFLISSTSCCCCKSCYCISKMILFSLSCFTFTSFILSSCSFLSNSSLNCCPLSLICSFFSFNSNSFSLISNSSSLFLVSPLISSSHHQLFLSLNQQAFCCYHSFSPIHLMLLSFSQLFYPKHHLVLCALDLSHLLFPLWPFSS